MPGFMLRDSDKMNRGWRPLGLIRESFGEVEKWVDNANCIKVMLARRARHRLLGTWGSFGLSVCLSISVGECDQGKLGGSDLYAKPGCHTETHQANGGDRS